MGFVMLGVLLVALKLLDLGPTAVWAWWVVLAPFGLAVVWWAWADSSGYTKRKEMEKMDERKAARRMKNMVSLGIDPRKHHKQSERADAYKQKRQRDVDKIESKREAERQKNRDSIVNSRVDSRLGSSRIDSTHDTKR